MKLQILSIALVLFVSPLLAQEKFAIYITPYEVDPVSREFTDVSRRVIDSTGDLRNALRDDFKIVYSRPDADIVLWVTDGSTHFPSVDRTTISRSGDSHVVDRRTTGSVPIRVLGTYLIIPGTEYRKYISAGAILRWRSAASKIADEVVAWADQNKGTLIDYRDTPPHLRSDAKLFTGQPWEIERSVDDFTDETEVTVQTSGQNGDLHLHVNCRRGSFGVSVRNSEFETSLDAPTAPLREIFAEMQELARRRHYDGEVRWDGGEVERFDFLRDDDVFVSKLLAHRQLSMRVGGGTTDTFDLTGAADAFAGLECAPLTTGRSAAEGSVRWIQRFNVRSRARGWHARRPRPCQPCPRGRPRARGGRLSLCSLGLGPQPRLRSLGSVVQVALRLRGVLIPLCACAD